jgi:radical SAM superfamily enzyme YgiQ (UPF0313 family)
MEKHEFKNILPKKENRIIGLTFPKQDINLGLEPSIGCPFKCDFCGTPMMCPTLSEKPLELVAKECEALKKYNPKYIFIRDENFPLQKTWKERLKLISNIGAKIYLFASANLLNDDVIEFMAEHNVYMICLGLEDITVSYNKNEKLDEVCSKLKEHGIYTYLSFIVDPLKIVGREKGEDFYNKLINRLESLKPEMICGNFLMPFRGTKIWDYYYLVSPDDLYRVSYNQLS